MEVKLLQATPFPKAVIAQAASVCYDSIPHDRIVDHCFESGHHSVLEHAVFTFEISGVSRALSHQLVRHRIASFSQRSQRYCTEDGFEYITPQSIVDEGYGPLYDELMNNIQVLYSRMVQDGVPGEDARFVLPNATTTKLSMTINLRSLMNFMGLRCCSHSQWEIRELANLMKAELLKTAHELEPFLQPKCIHIGYCSEKKCCGLMPKKKDVIGKREA